MTDKKEKTKLTKREKIVIGGAIVTVVCVSGIFIWYVKKTPLPAAVISEKLGLNRITSDEKHCPSIDIKGSSLSNSPITVTQTVKVIERIGRGHPGYLVKCNETGEYFRSQAAAAKYFGVPASYISQQILGLKEHVGGKTFSRHYFGETLDLAA